LAHCLRPTLSRDANFAALRGQTGPTLPEELSHWVAGCNITPPPAIAERAPAALRRIATDPALSEIWRASGLLNAWRANIDELARRLTCGAGGPATAAAQTDRMHSAEAASPPAKQLPLARRVHAFLDDITPFEGYASGSAVEDCLRLFAGGGHWDDDARGELRICYSAVLDEIESDAFTRFSDRRRRYLKGCASLLREVMLEILGDAERIDLG
jgi:hypothetical protein